MIVVKKQTYFLIWLAFSLTLLSVLLIACDRGGGRGAAAGDRFPTRPVEVIMHFGPGGGTDLYVRSIAVDGSRNLGQSVVPVSVTGGGGMYAWERFVSQPADGHTLFALGPEQIIMHNLDMIDLLAAMYPLMRSQSDTFVYFSRGDDARFPTIEAVIEYARANPGSLTIAGTSPASFDEVHIGLFAIEHGIEINYVPFPSAAQAFAAVLGGSVDILGEEVGPAADLIQSGHLRPLVVFVDMDSVDNPMLANIRTSQALGWSSSLTMGRWRGLGIARGTDPEQKRIFVDAFYRAMQGTAYRNMERENLLDIRPGFMGTEEFTEFFRTEIEIYRRVMDAIGM